MQYTNDYRIRLFCTHLRSDTQIENDNKTLKTRCTPSETSVSVGIDPQILARRQKLTMFEVSNTKKLIASSTKED